MKLIFILFCTLLTTTLCAQKKIDSSGQVAFVYYENRPTNLIVIPNIDKLFSFKIFTKKPTDQIFVLVGEKKKPLLPMRYNISPYAVTWEDKHYQGTEIEYKVIAFDKKGVEICSLNVIWENTSAKQYP